MKLLIVDDEELTRVGVISSINWQSIGIDEVLQADDGMNGLEMARMHKPDIILCDVRMPRLDGIQMLEQLETILPDVVPVFMSGYSDKEYLKAAIKLKAVNYIEKPLDPLEIQDAVIEARDLCLERKRTDTTNPSIPWKMPPAWPFCLPSLTLKQKKTLTSCWQSFPFP